jgi:hypothetical protein
MGKQRKDEDMIGKQGKQRRRTYLSHSCRHIKEPTVASLHCAARHTPLPLQSGETPRAQLV